MKMKKIDVSSMTKRQLIEKSNTTVIMSLAVTAFVVAFAIVFMNFLWDLSSHNRRVISGKSEASKSLKANVENIVPLQQNFTVFEAGDENDVKSDDVLDALPSKYDFPALATSIQSLVERSGLTLDSFSGDDNEGTAAQSQTDPLPVEIPFSFAVRGPYEDVRKLLDSIDRTIRPIKILSMEIKGQDSQMQVSFSALTYYQPAVSLDVETRTVE